MSIGKIAMAAAASLLGLLAVQESVAEGNTVNFRLQAARSQRAFGPFSYINGARIRLETGDYQLAIRDGQHFRLVDPVRNVSFGDYKLVLGRMIDVDETLFTIAAITDAGTPRGPSMVAATAAGTRIPEKRGGVAGTRIPVTIGGGYDQSATSYRWEANGKQRGSAHDIERARWGAWLSRDWWSIRGGISTDVSWNHTIAGDGATFQEATLDSGSGWWVGADVIYPFFDAGRWSADALGAFSYSSEEMTLSYSQLTSRQASREELVEGSTNETVQVSYTELLYQDTANEATLQEWLIQVGATLTYTTERWMLYGGVNIDLATEAELSATIKTSSTVYELDVEREHPITLWGGGKVTLGTATRVLLEGRAGSSTGIRIGIEREF